MPTRKGKVDAGDVATNRRARHKFELLDRFECGIELVGTEVKSLREGRAQLGFRVEKRHTNPLNNCHGGMLASFGDMLLPVCIHRQSAEVGHRFLPTISLQIDYLAPAPLGAWVQGEAEVLRVTRTMVFANGVARVDGTPVVRVSGIFKIGQPFDRPVEPAG